MKLLDEEFMKRATPEDIKKQLAAGADVNARDKEGFTPLSYALRWSKDSKVVRALIKAGADVHVYVPAPPDFISVNEKMRAMQEEIEARFEAQEENREHTE